MWVNEGDGDEAPSTDLAATHIRATAVEKKLKKKVDKHNKLLIIGNVNGG